MYILEYKDGAKPEKLSPKAKANMERCANFHVTMIEKIRKKGSGRDRMVGED